MIYSLKVWITVMIVETSHSNCKWENWYGKWFNKKSLQYSIIVNSCQKGSLVVLCLHVYFKFSTCANLCTDQHPAQWHPEASKIDF